MRLDKGRKRLRGWTMQGRDTSARCRGSWAKRQIEILKRRGQRGVVTISDRQTKWLRQKIESKRVKMVPSKKRAHKWGRLWTRMGRERGKIRCRKILSKKA